MFVSFSRLGSFPSRRTQGKLVIRVHVEDVDRRAANSGLTDDGDASPYKMRIPLLSSWMEQLRHFIRVRINTCQIRTFVQVTIDAGQGKVSQLVRAAVFLGDDVLDMQYGERRIFLMELAILAPIASPLSNQDLCGLREHLSRRPEQLAGLSLQNGNELVRADIAFIFRPFFF
jgi:hypothetical protein